MFGIRSEKSGLLLFRNILNLSDVSKMHCFILSLQSNQKRNTMIIFILTVLLIPISILTHRHYIGKISIIVFFIGLVFITYSGLNVTSNNLTFMTEYEIAYTQMKIINTDKNISDDEKQKFINNICSVNEKILNNRKYSKNIWIGIAFSEAIGNFDIIDTSEISAKHVNIW